LLAYVALTKAAVFRSMLTKNQQEMPAASKSE